MILIIPHINEMQPVDQRLARLAEFLGIDCVPVPLAKSAGDWAEYLQRTIPQREACFVVNPRVLQCWVGGDRLPESLALFLVSSFSHLLVHAPRTQPFDGSLIRALSCGNLEGLQGIDRSDESYEIASDARDVCEGFAGLSFGPANIANDRVFSCVNDARGVRNLIRIGGRPFLATTQREKSEIWFLAAQDVADLDSPIGEAPVSEYFSRLLPPAMALRSIFGEESWRPGEPQGSVIIDDPLLRREYGFLNFESLLSLMKQHNFHSTIAFIPHNFKRSSSRITRMFRENPGHFSLCFHGNDHTAAEFASSNKALLNTLLRLAERRMELHKETTGLECDRVMVFPQGNFSIEAMAVLNSRNFDGAVNTTPHPMHSNLPITLREIAQPAILRYGNFPLFLRKDSLHTQSEDVAFNCFFGKPVLLVEHHDIFQKSEVLAEAAARINKVAPNIHWSNIGNILRQAILQKRAPTGVHHMRAYSRVVQISNETDCAKSCLVEWPRSVQPGSPSETLMHNGTPCLIFNGDAAAIQFSADLPANSSHTFSLVCQNPHGDLGSLGLRHRTKAFVRRRLSEVRDNFLSKTPRVLTVARAIQRRLPL